MYPLYQLLTTGGLATLGFRKYAKKFIDLSDAVLLSFLHSRETKLNALGKGGCQIIPRD